jgi:DNA repair protein RadD
MVREWIREGEHDEEGLREGRPRRFDQGMLVDNEIIGEFISQSFLDPDDDRVLNEMLDREIPGAAGLRVRDLRSKEELREILRQRQEENSRDPVEMPVQPQRRRVAARKRLQERSKSVAARVLQDLSLSPQGREIGRAVKAVSGRANLQAAIELMNRRVNEHLGIERASRGKIDADQAEDGLAALDMIGDQVREEIEAGLGS